MKQTLFKDSVCGKRGNRQKAHIAIDYIIWYLPLSEEETEEVSGYLTYKPGDQPVFRRG